MCSLGALTNNPLKGEMSYLYYKNALFSLQHSYGKKYWSYDKKVKKKTDLELSAFSFLAV